MVSGLQEPSLSGREPCETQKGSLVAAVKESTSCYSPSRVTVSPYRKRWSVGDLYTPYVLRCVLQQRGTKGCVYIVTVLFLLFFKVYFERGFLNNAFIFSSAVLTFRVEAINRSQIFGSDASFYTRTKTINVHPEIVTTLMNRRTRMLG